MTAPTIDVCELRLGNPGGRALFDQLRLRLERGRVALVGRNGVGKSTLLRALAGEVEPERGKLRTSSAPVFVPQQLERCGARLSHGEQRRDRLERAFAACPQILLLDEPSEDLDDEGVSWLRRALEEQRGLVVVASHDRRLLGDFEVFLVVSEIGCRKFVGSLSELETSLEAERSATERRYVSQLAELADAERRTLQIELRKGRKKRYGRLSELDRATPKIRLNQKRSDAQVSHGRLARLRQQRLDALRGLTKAARRAISVELSMKLFVPELPEEPSVVLRFREGNLLLELGRERIGVVGPNGAGKTTLLQAALKGAVSSRALAQIGVVTQGASDFRRKESLVRVLVEQSAMSADDAFAVLAAHKFPLGLAQRPLASLSPGERTRAALIALFQRRPAVELLVLDEPTFSLDLLGQRALTDGLKAFPGGLLVASHDRAFLAEIGVTRLIQLPTDLRAARTSA